MFTIIKNWFETASFRSDIGLARKQMRDARREMRLVGKDAVYFKKFDEVSAPSNIIMYEDAAKTFKAYALTLHVEAGTIINIATEHRTLIARNMEKIEEFESNFADWQRNVLENAQNGKLQNIDREQLAAQQTRVAKLQQQLDKMKQDMTKGVQAFFQVAVTFENTNFKASQLLDEASLIRQLFYDAKKSRSEVRTFNKDIAKITKETRSIHLFTEDDLKLAEKSVAALDEELKDQFDLLTMCIQLLYKIQKEIARTKEHLATKVEQGSYPKKWKDEHLKILANVEKLISDWDQHEIQRARIELSKAEHQLAA